MSTRPTQIQDDHIERTFITSMKTLFLNGDTQGPGLGPEVFFCLLWL